eukprot:7196921-Ditylum_brightwellii.AAC.1
MPNRATKNSQSVTPQSKNGFTIHISRTHKSRRCTLLHGADLHSCSSIAPTHQLITVVVALTSPINIWLVANHQKIQKDQRQ